MSKDIDNFNVHKIIFFQSYVEDKHHKINFPT